MNFFGTKDPDVPAIRLGDEDWASVYIKWDDDRGRGFDNVTRFRVDEDWIELTYTHPEAGDVEIKIRNHGIRWIEFFKTKVESDQE